MTIKELKMLLDEQIEKGNGDMEVKIVTNYGDITNTKQSLDILFISIGKEKESAYSLSGRIVMENGIDFVEDEIENDVQEYIESAIDVPDIFEVDNDRKFFFISSERLNMPQKDIIFE